MFDFDAGKLLIIGVVALIVIGPKDLPRVLRQVGQAVSRLRRMAGEFQGQFMDAMKEAEIQDIRDEITKIGTDTKLDAHFDPVRDVKTELTRAIEPAAAVEPLSPSAPTAAFMLPNPPASLADEVSETTAPVDTVAASGIAPFAPEEVADASLSSASVSDASKRRIVVPKRRSSPSGSRDNLQPRVVPNRFRNVRPRRPETTEI